MANGREVAEEATNGTDTVTPPRGEGSARSAGGGCLPDTSNIVYGPHTPEKRELARRLRAEMTPAEAILWERLRANRLRRLQFRRQQIIDGFIVDFYCHAAALVVEVDGDVHDEQQEYDEARDRVLQSRGLRVLRVRNERVMGDLQGVLREIARACLNE